MGYGPRPPLEAKGESSGEQHPLDRLASPRVDRPIDLELLTPTYPPLTPTPPAQRQRASQPHQASPGADGGGPPFCELRNGPRSNARDKFTGCRAGERSRLKIQPSSNLRKGDCQCIFVVACRLPLSMCAPVYNTRPHVGQGSPSSRASPVATVNPGVRCD